MTPEKVVLNKDEMARAIARIAYEIIERTGGAKDIVVLGIPSRGVQLASRIADRISEITESPVPAGALDITMYRDDLAHQPIRTPHPTHIPGGGLEGKTVVLVDDVLYTGRTVKAALDALFDIGRPAAVRLAVLVDRGHRELPIRPDFVGKNLPTSRLESVDILLEETDERDAVIIREGK